MSWRRVALILLFDLRYRVLTWQGAFFLVPFVLLWYPLLRTFDQRTSAWLSEREGFMLIAALLDPQTANSLLVEHAPLLSAFFLIVLYTAPFFALLAGCDQFASDLGNGFLRFLSARCLRIEIFLGRYLGAFCMLSVAYLCAAVAAAAVSLQVDQKSLAETALYLVQILLSILLYTAPLLALASIASALSRSAAGALFLGMSGYALALIAIHSLDTLVAEAAWLAWLLPSAIRAHLFGIDALESVAAVTALPVYTLVYAWIAWRIFKMRNF